MSALAPRWQRQEREPTGLGQEEAKGREVKPRGNPEPNYVAGPCEPRKGCGFTLQDKKEPTEGF